MKYFPILLLVLSCQSHSKKDADPFEEKLKTLLLEKRALYLASQPSALNEHGYAHGKCDSVGFTSLCKAAGGCAEADVFASETNGRWFRSPEKDCFDKGESKSDFSKDMALMLFIYLNQLSKSDPVKAAEAIARFRAYVKSNNFIMGRPSDSVEGLSRVLMSPSLISIMNKLYEKLSARAGIPFEKIPEEKKEEADVLPVINVGFQAHLDVISIWLKGELDGSINDIDRYVLDRQVARQPRNAVFQAVHHLYSDGNQIKTLEILADETLFPNDRLPTSADHCEEYIFQRDDDSDWQPCDESKTHDSVDYLFAGYLAGLWGIE